MPYVRLLGAPDGDGAGDGLPAMTITTNQLRVGIESLTVHCSANFKYKKKPKVHPVCFVLAFGCNIESTMLTLCLYRSLDINTVPDFTLDR